MIGASIKPRTWIRFNYVVLTLCALLAFLNGLGFVLTHRWQSGVLVVLMIGVFFLYLPLNRKWREIEAQQKELNDLYRPER